MSRTSRRAAFTSAATSAATEGPTGLMARLSAFPRLVRDVLTGQLAFIWLPEVDAVLAWRETSGSGH